MSELDVARDNLKKAKVRYRTAFSIMEDEAFGNLELARAELFSATNNLKQCEHIVSILANTNK